MNHCLWVTEKDSFLLLRELRQRLLQVLCYSDLHQTPRYCLLPTSLQEPNEKFHFDRNFEKCHLITEPKVGFAGLEVPICERPESIVELDDNDIFLLDQRCRVFIDDILTAKVESSSVNPHDHGDWIRSFESTFCFSIKFTGGWNSPDKTEQKSCPGNTKVVRGIPTLSGEFQRCPLNSNGVREIPTPLYFEIKVFKNRNEESAIKNVPCRCDNFQVETIFVLCSTSRERQRSCYHIWSGRTWKTRSGKLVACGELWKGYLIYLTDYLTYLKIV